MEELGEIGFERSTYSHLLALGEVKGSETLMIWITQIAVQMNDPSDKHGGSVVSMIDIPSFSPHDMWSPVQKEDARNINMFRKTFT